MSRDVYIKKPVAKSETEIKEYYKIKPKNSELILGIEDDYVQGVQKPLIWDLQKGGLLCLGNRENVHSFSRLLMKKPAALIYIGSLVPKEGVADFISYKDEEEIIVLLKRILAYPHVLNRFLIIEDLNVLLTMNEKIRDDLYKIISICKEKGLLVFAFCNQVNSIPYRYYGLFPGRLAYKRLDDEQMKIFMPNLIKGECLLYEKAIHSFVPCIPESINHLDKYKPFLPPKNRVLKACVCHGKILIGEYKHSRIDAFVEYTNVWITACEESFLKAYVPYRSLGVHVAVFKSGDSFVGYEHIVWVGTRLLSQKNVPLFIREDVSENEVMWIHDKKGKVLRSLCSKM